MLDVLASVVTNHHLVGHHQSLHEAFRADRAFGPPATVATTTTATVATATATVAGLRRRGGVASGGRGRGVGVGPGGPAPCEVCREENPGGFGGRKKG